MARKRTQTELDLAVPYVNIPLIWLTVGCLAEFLAVITFQGEHQDRVAWTIGFYVLGMIGVTRIEIELGNDDAIKYGFLLGLAGIVALVKFLQGGLISFLVLTLIWWISRKITYDTSVIDEDRENSGAGLLRAAGLEQGTAGDLQSVQIDRRKKSLKPTESDPSSDNVQSGDAVDDRPWWKKVLDLDATRRPHSPGKWVVYFALAALPIFGLGQTAIPANDHSTRKIAFWCLLGYVVGSASLLVTSSFLGLRRYLRQRNVQMPVNIAGVWLGLGGTLIAGLILAAILIPRPNPEYRISSLWGVLKGETVSATPISYHGGSGGTGEGDAGGSREEKEEEDKPQESGRGPESSPQGQQSSAQGKDKSQDTQGKSQDSQGRDDAGSKGEPSSSRNADASDQGKGGEQKSKSGSSQGDSSSKKDSQQSESNGGEKNKEKQQGDGKSDSKSGKSEAEKSQSGNSKNGEEKSKESSSEKSEEQKSEAEKSAQEDSEQENSEQENSEAKKSELQKSGSGGSPFKSSPDKKTSGGTPQPAKQNAGQGSPNSKSLMARIKDFFRDFKPLRWLRWVLYAVVCAIVLYYVWKNRQQVADFFRRLWLEFLSLFAGKPAGKQESLPETKPVRSFASYGNPFTSFMELSTAELVTYTFDALQAWGRENGLPRSLELTPVEFVRLLAEQSSLPEDDLKLLAQHYGAIAYAGTDPPASARQVTQRLWNAMTHLHSHAGA